MLPDGFELKNGLIYLAAAHSLPAMQAGPNFLFLKGKGGHDRGLYPYPPAPGLLLPNIYKLDRATSAAFGICTLDGLPPATPFAMGSRDHLSPARQLQVMSFGINK